MCQDSGDLLLQPSLKKRLLSLPINLYYRMGSKSSQHLWSYLFWHGTLHETGNPQTHTVLFMISNTMKKKKYEKNLIKTISLPFLKASNFKFLADLFSWVLTLSSPGIFNTSLRLVFHNLRDLHVRNSFHVTSPFSNLLQ